jgi:hypothetical protein
LHYSCEQKYVVHIHTTVTLGLMFVMIGWKLEWMQDSTVRAWSLTDKMVISLFLVFPFRVFRVPFLWCAGCIFIGSLFLSVLGVWCFFGNRTGTSYKYTL